jgi:adiponectin receptor
MPFSPTQSQITRWPFFVFLSGAMCCLLFSSTYHLLNCHSHRWHVILHRLDHAGIAILIAASFYPPVYYSFLCHPVLRTGYLSAITLLGLATILFSSLPMFRTPEFRPIRALLFVCMGASGVVPGVHKLLLFKEDPAAVSTVLYELAMGGFYFVGALLYATRIPERLKPGYFDIVGHSHQIFHILVVAGAYTHYLAGLIYLKWRDEFGCPKL